MRSRRFADRARPGPELQRGRVAGGCGLRSWSIAAETEWCAWWTWTQDRVRTFPAAPYANDVALSPDGTRVVSIGGLAGDADLVRPIDVETGKVQRIPQRTTDSCRSHGARTGGSSPRAVSVARSS